MRFFKYLFGLISLLTLIAAADKTTKASSTTIWITTTVGGKKTTMQTVFSQSFMSTYTSADEGDVQSGNIGLGSISGTVGDVRSYTKTTIGTSNAAVGLFKPENIYSGIAGVSFLLLGALL